MDVPRAALGASWRWRYALASASSRGEFEFGSVSPDEHLIVPDQGERAARSQGRRVAGIDLAAGACSAGSAMSDSTAGLGRRRQPRAARCLAAMGLLLACTFLRASSAGAQTEQTLVSNIGESGQADVQLCERCRAVQEFTVGSTSHYLTSLVLRVTGANGGLRVAIHEADGSDPASTSLYDLIGPSSLSTGLTTFTAPAGASLAADSNYFVVIRNGGYSPESKIRRVSSNDQSGVSGWTIANDHRRRVNGIWTTSVGSIAMGVNGYAIPSFTATIEEFDSVEREGGSRRNYRFDVKLSERAWIPWRDMRDHAFEVTNGNILSSESHSTRPKLSYNGQTRAFSDHWRLQVRATDSDSAVTVALKGLPCGKAGRDVQPAGRRRQQYAVAHDGRGRGRVQSPSLSRTGPAPRAARSSLTSRYREPRGTS